jgi:hypothetical protein
MGARSGRSEFDPDFATPSEWARMYRNAGFQVVPAYYPEERPQWKRPCLDDWKGHQNELVPEFTFARWYGETGTFSRRQNMGLVTGRASGNTFVVDLDTHRNDEARRWWSELLQTHNGGLPLTTIEQRTGGGGRQILFRGPEGWTAPTNKTGIGVDIRGQGGFAMLPPSRHDSGLIYQWLPRHAPTEIGVLDAPGWLLEAVERLVAEHGGGEREGPRPASQSTSSPANAYDAFGHRIDGREEAMRDLVWASVVNWWRECPIPPSEVESTARMREVFQDYERKTRSRLNIAGVPNAELLEREGRGYSLFAEKWRRAIKQWDDEVAEAGKERPLDDDEPAPVAPDVPPGIALEDAFPIDAAAIPTRDWIVPGLLLRRYLTLLVAPPGSGKSLLTLQVAIMCAAGLAWGGWRTRAPCKVLVINAEDDLDEMRRRLWAAADLMGVSHTALAGRVMLVKVPESIVIARTDPRTRAVQRTALIETLVQTIVDQQIDVAIADPFAETFEGDENSNSEAKWAGIIWREIARRTNTSVFLVHHTRKYSNGMAGDADAARGASALIGTARIVSTLFGMAEDEASALDVPPQDRGLYVRFDDAKANMTLVTKAARWFRKRTITVPNGTGIIPGDEVGAFEPWTPPGTFEGVSVNVLNTLLDVIARGVLDDDGHPTGALFSPSKRSDKRWAGIVIAQHLACSDERAGKVLSDWLKNGVLVETTYNDHKQDRKGLKVDETKRPGRSC